jgi:hypothetical protein
MSVVVGLFRSDVLYVNDIDIDIKDGDATRTLFNNLAQYMSDRLFYAGARACVRACGLWRHKLDLPTVPWEKADAGIRLHAPS